MGAKDLDFRCRRSEKVPKIGIEAKQICKKSTLRMIIKCL